MMVCKIIDEGWEKFIVENKVNKSHFGSNIYVKNKTAFQTDVRRKYEIIS